MKTKLIVYGITMLIITLFTMCNSRNAEMTGRRVVAASPVINDTYKQDTGTVPQQVERRSLVLNTKSLISLLSCIKSMTATNSSAPPNAAYDRWKLDSAAVLQILRHSALTNFQALDAAYDMLPCDMTGEVDIDHVRYRYTVNGGSWGTLRSADTSYYFYCGSKRCEKYFLSTAYVGE